jgi:excisionase family DNA binding protein
MTDRLLTLDQVCERVQLSTWAIRRAIDRGELPAFKPCGRIRIAESALAAWLDSTTSGGSEGVAPRKSPRRRSTESYTFRRRVSASRDQ